MDNLKNKPLYNTMYFDESETDPYHLNREFWGELNDLCRNHPEIIITVERFVIKDRNVSHLLEDVRVACDHELFQKRCDEIYRSLYYRAPLKFHKEFEGRDDVLKELFEKN